jgi:hypothetical protein
MLAAWRGREITKAVAYLRTSSKTNLGPDKDSDKRQLAAIAAYAKANGFDVVDTYYDAAVSGADPVTGRAFRRCSSACCPKGRGQSLSRDPPSQFPLRPVNPNLSRLCRGHRPTLSAGFRVSGSWFSESAANQRPSGITAGEDVTTAAARTGRSASTTDAKRGMRATTGLEHLSRAACASCAASQDKGFKSLRCRSARLRPWCLSEADRKISHY